MLHTLVVSVLAVRAVRLLAFAALLAIAAFSLAPSAWAQNIHPPLYVVRDADSTMYLFGTIHVRRAGDDWGGPEAHRALAEAQEVWTEIEFSDEVNQRSTAMVMREGMSPAGQRVSSWLTAEQRARFQEQVSHLRVPYAYVDGMRPWLAALTLSMLPAMQRGYEPQSGADRALTREATHARRRAFETPEQQIGFLSGMSEAAQREMFLDAMNSSDGMGDFTRLTLAWETGDIATLERIVITDMRRDSPDMYDVMFRRRNAAWVRTLDEEMHGAGVDFVAVGAGHLLGSDGLVAQLRALGYSVEQLSPAVLVSQTGLAG